MPKDQIPAGHLFSTWLSEVAKDTREEHGVSRERVADLAGKTATTIKRFEEAGAGTNESHARLIAAYAEACGLADGRELYRAAIDRWHEQCARPLTTASLRVDHDAALAAAADDAVTDLRSASRPRAPRAPKRAAKRSRRA